jgi:hypothetical protein
MKTLSAMQRNARSAVAIGAMMLVPLGVIGPVAAHASGARLDAVSAGEVQNPSDGGAEADRWWGAVSAALCGAEIALVRTMPAVGMQPALIAAGLGCCILALMDICSTK